MRTSGHAFEDPVLSVIVRQVQFLNWRKFPEITIPKNVNEVTEHDRACLDAYWEDIWSDTSFGWSNGHLKETLQWDLTRFTSGKLRMQIWKLTRKKLSEMVEVRLVWRHMAAHDMHSSMTLPGSGLVLTIQWRCWENGQHDNDNSASLFSYQVFIISSCLMIVWLCMWFSGCNSHLERVPIESSIDETLTVFVHVIMGPWVTGWKGCKGRREGEPQWRREGDERPVGDS